MDRVDLSVAPGRLRRWLQWGIAGLLLFSGIRYTLWVFHFRYGTPYVPRPASVEAFLPISALVALKAWVATGVFPTVHPAGLAILLAVLLTALVFHRGLCSWACPIGLLEEYLGKLGIRGLGRKVTPPRWLDYPLRAIKYLLLAFFLKVILLDMSGRAAMAFLHSPYNKVAAVKMLDFWLHPGPWTIGIVGFLVVGSLVVQNLWCRYLCPYGALLSVIGLLSPATVNINRDETACDDCGLCTQTCPNYVDVQSAGEVTALECTRCAQCIETCPENALDFRAGPVEVSPRAVGLGIVGIVFLVVAVAMLTGHWESSLTYADWTRLVPAADQIMHTPY
ncbi:MAG: 4Fe-4S binding protein [Halodesulfurarchaeum sp.]